MGKESREQASALLPALIGIDEFQPVIPWQGGLHQSLPLLHRPASECDKLTLLVNLCWDKAPELPRLTPTACQNLDSLNRRQSDHLIICENCPNNRDHRSCCLARLDDRINLQRTTGKDRMIKTSHG
jgi:hypothetical protein